MSAPDGFGGPVPDFGELWGQVAGARLLVERASTAIVGGLPLETQLCAVINTALSALHEAAQLVPAARERALRPPAAPEDCLCCRGLIPRALEPEAVCLRCRAQFRADPREFERAVRSRGMHRCAKCGAVRPWGELREVPTIMGGLGGYACLGGCDDQRA